MPSIIQYCCNIIIICSVQWSLYVIELQKWELGTETYLFLTSLLFWVSQKWYWMSLKFKLLSISILDKFDTMYRPSNCKSTQFGASKSWPTWFLKIFKFLFWYSVSIAVNGEHLGAWKNKNLQNWSHRFSQLKEWTDMDSSWKPIKYNNNIYLNKLLPGRQIY